MKILQLSPAFFSSESVLGGAERYVLELARALSEKHETVLMSFSSKKKTERIGKLQLDYTRSKYSLKLLKAILWADVIHCHQVFIKEADKIFNLRFHS